MTSASVKNVVVVDDDEDIRKYLNKVLEEAGMNVCLCSSGKQLIELLKKDGIKIDLILLDLSMPEINGLEVLKLIQGIKKTKGFKVCVVSGYNDKKVILKASELSADDYLTKPFDKAILLNRVQSLTESSKINPTDSIFVKVNFTAVLLNLPVIVNFNIVEIYENRVTIESTVNFKEGSIVAFSSKPFIASTHCEENLNIKIIKIREEKNKFFISALFSDLSEQSAQSIKIFVDRHAKAGSSLV